MNCLSYGQKLSFWRSGFLHLPGYLRGDLCESVAGWVEDLAERAADARRAGELIPYWEGEGSERRIGRVENFVPSSPGLREFLTRGDLPSLASDLMGEPAVLFKEKINFKLPGAGGFGPHQDAPAFTQFGQTYHITIAISVDASGPKNGGLELVDGRHREGIFPHPHPEDLTIDPGVAAQMDFRLQETRTEDLLIFHSFTPHRSKPNHSNEQRRMVFATYALRSEGDHRSEYYRFKREHPNDPTLVVGIPFRLDAAASESLDPPVYSRRRPRSRHREGRGSRQPNAEQSSS